MKFIPMALEFLWEKTPWYIKVPLLVFIGPMVSIVLLMWFLLLMPMSNNEIHSAVSKSEERLDQKLNSTVERHNLELKSVNENLKRIDQHQTIMFEAMVNKK